MFKLSKKITKKQLLLVFISIAFVTFQVWLDLKIPDYMNEITKLVQTRFWEILLCSFQTPKCMTIVLSWPDSAVNCFCAGVTNLKGIRHLSWQINYNQHISSVFVEIPLLCLLVLQQSSPVTPTYESVALLYA